MDALMKKLALALTLSTLSASSFAENTAGQPTCIYADKSYSVGSMVKPDGLILVCVRIEPTIYSKPNDPEAKWVAAK
jgi:hypothetical protein